MNFGRKHMNIVAEVGINHNGIMPRAKDMIKKLSGGYVTHVKFQKATPKIFVPEAKYNAPHPKPWNSFGFTYGDHKEHLEFTAKQHAELKSFCEYNGLKYAVSVCDDNALSEMLPIKPDYIKVPSCLNYDLRFINKIASEFEGKVHVSLGMTSRDEREKLFAYCSKYKNKFVFYECTSDYSGDSPVYMQDRFDEIKGFSCHNPSQAFGIIAASRGAEWIEYHCTFDRESKGTDHKVSLTVNEMKDMARSISRIALIQPRPDDVPYNEQSDRARLR
jgi:sialic acid synthase